MKDMVQENVNTPLLEAIGLKKYFKTGNGLLHAVDGVDLSIPKGKTLGLVGESGCGKSTLGRLLLRLIEATEGEVRYAGENILNYRAFQMREMRKKIQIIFQDPYSSLDSRMSVFQLIAEPLLINRIYSNRRDLERRVNELMETVGLASRLSNSYPHELDGGRRQRVGIARSLALNPEFIVCDEPVSALDVSIQAQILNLLMDLQDQMGLTYVFITHDLSVVRHISDECAVMYLGQIVEKTNSKELFKNPVHPYTQALLKAIPVPRLSAAMSHERILKGELSSPVNPAPGCRFASRCPKACEACKKDLQLREVSPEHYVMCSLWN